MSSRHSLVAFAALSTAYYAYLGFFNPYLPLWLKDSGYSLVVISWLVSLQSISRVLAPYAWGVLSDRTGNRVGLLRRVSLIAWVSSLGLWWPQGGLLWLGLVLAIAYIHTSAMMPMNEAAMASLISTSGQFDAGRYGRVRLWGSIGFLFTVFGAGAWFEVFGMSHFPAWTAITLGLVAIASWRLPNIREPAHAKDTKASVWPVLKQPRTRWFFAALFFHVLAHIGVYVFFSLYLDHLGYSKTVIGVMWALSVMAEIVWFFMQGRWAHKMRVTRWLLLCSAVTVVRMAMTASWADIWPLLVLAQLTHAITFAAHHSACIAMLSDLFPARLRGRGQALFTTIGYGLTGVLGGGVGSVIASHWGLGRVFWASTLVSLLAVACAWKLDGLVRGTHRHLANKLPT